MFDVEVGAATAKISKLSNKLDSLNKSMGKGAGTGKKVTSSINNWGTGITKAVGALATYRAASMSIQSVTDAIKESWDAIIQRQKQAAGHQQTVGRAIQALNATLGEGRDITIEEIKKMVESARTNDQAGLVGVIQRGVSSKLPNTSAKNVTEAVIALHGDTDYLDDEDRSGLSLSAVQLADASRAWATGASAADIGKAFGHATNRFTQHAYSDDQGTATRNLLPAVKALMQQGVEMKNAMAFTAQLSTLGADPLGRQAKSTTINMMKQLDGIYKDTLGLNKMQELEDKGFTKNEMLEVIMGVASKEVRAMVGDENVNKVRLRAKGLQNATRQELAKFLAKTGQTEWNQQAIEYAKSNDVGMDAEMTSRAQMFVALNRILSGEGDKEANEGIKTIRADIGDYNTRAGLERASRKWDETFQKGLDGAGDARRLQRESEIHQEISKGSDVEGVAYAAADALDKKRLAKNMEQRGYGGVIGTGMAMTDQWAEWAAVMTARGMGMGSPKRTKELLDSVDAGISTDRGEYDEKMAGLSDSQRRDARMIKIMMDGNSALKSITTILEGLGGGEENSASRFIRGTAISEGASEHESILRKVVSGETSLPVTIVGTQGVNSRPANPDSNQLNNSDR